MNHSQHMDEYTAQTTLEPVRARPMIYGFELRGILWGSVSSEDKYVVPSTTWVFNTMIFEHI